MRLAGARSLMGSTEENTVEKKANKGGGIGNGESCLEAMRVS